MKRIEKFLNSKMSRVVFALTIAIATALGLVNPAFALPLAAVLAVKAIESQGVTLSYSVGSPTSFATIANVTGFSGPGGSASVIDVTNLSSVAKEKLMGLPDEGQFTINLNLDPDDASHTALRAARAARTRVEFKITFTDTTPATAIFFGYVLGFQVSGAVDQQVKADLTIEIDGPVTWA